MHTPLPQDAIILGGGINGIGLAHDLVSRGYRNVTLVEKNSLASGTSSKSTKLIHGGLRYLQYPNQIKLLFNITLSISGKKWKDIHPEHLRIILLNLQNYKEGTIINDILLEILEDNKII